jgi:hypothetical protein
MFLNSGHRTILASAAAGLIFAIGTTAHADDSRRFFLMVSPSDGEWRATDHCAAYGPDFTSVAGSDACVRIGGRVRVQVSIRGYSSDNGQTWTTSRSVAVHTEGTPVGTPAQAEGTSTTIDGIDQGHVHVHSVGASDRADPYHQ